MLSIVSGSASTQATPREESTQSLTEKDVPHEQPCSACGLLTTWNELRISSWLKSTIAPFTKARLSTSTTTRAPSCSNTLSSGLITVSKENLYWNPEQPPPSTCSLRNSEPSIISSSLFTQLLVREICPSLESDTGCPGLEEDDAHCTLMLGT